MKIVTPLKSPWLLLDCNNLCHRAFHAIKGMEHNGRNVSVIYGFMRDLAIFRRDFGSNNFIFCWDHGKNKRKEIHPTYKMRAYRKHDPDLQKEREDTEAQIAEVKHGIIPRLGFVNNFFLEGYEADDLIASALQKIPTGDRVIIISGDKDLHQLLEGTSVIQYAPTQKVTYTEETFRNEYGLAPSEWVKIKAIAGEKGQGRDNIPGVHGVAEMRASEYLNGKLGANSNFRPKIIEWIASEQYQINLRLVSLPYENCSVPKPVEQEWLRVKDWDDVCREYSFHSLLGARAHNG